MNILAIMFIAMKDICDWAGTNPSQKRFVKGERMLEAGHIIKCGKSTDDDTTFYNAFMCI